ncbi:DNA polymerase III subunit delta [Telmatospirillum siberiense]|uniref:DNA-directed DNA polymerase n=1 Tax=Telmatospirillum siberiense TaxID=382514 RepID=A0A2N3PN13_9PROT|nr:DNA polymerase III subunit delta [Telmatospirillum siberiense]PKU21780.1 DNA polymerase III subunit delta [Telmatospirillum siberiense]
MKLAGNRIESFLKTPDAAARVVLVYGPDAGLVKERIARLTKGVCADTNDPFRIADLTATGVKDDPARLADEAAAIAMTGGRRVVRVHDAGDGVSQAVQSFLDHPAGDALVLLDAGELGPRSALRKLVEGADNAVALPCYADEGGSLEAVIHESLRVQGLTAEPDAVAWLADHLGGDRLLTRSELEKLALYMGGGGGRVRLEDVIACIGDTAALSLDDLSMACAEGDHPTAQRVLDRLYREGTSPIAVLRSLQRHFQRLHLASGAMGRGKSPDQALAVLRPPPHFRVAEHMRGQLIRWPAERLGTALDLLVNAEMDCKSTGMPAEEICSRTVMQLTRAAGRKGPAAQRR